MNGDDFDAIIYNDLDDEYVDKSVNDYYEYLVMYSMCDYENMIGILQQYFEHEKTCGHLEDAADEAAGVSEYDTSDIGW